MWIRALKMEDASYRMPFTEGRQDIIQMMSEEACLHHQPQLFDFSAVLSAGCHDINSGGVDAAVAENICQLRNILFHTVEGSGKQLPQIVREYLAGIYPGSFAQTFHLRPNRFPI